MPDVVTLAEGKLYALPNPYALNGFVSTHAPSASGFAPYQCYLAIEEGGAVLIDAGMSVHDKSLIAQIRSLISDDLPLTLFPLSIGEFRSVCNLRPLAETLNLVRMYGIVEGATTWADFRPECSPFGTVVGGGVLEKIETPLCHSGDSVPVGAAGDRRLLAMQPPIRLLPAHWFYDAATETLFTADSFNHVWRPTEDGPWSVGYDEPAPTADEVYDFLVTSRFWWLPGANTEPIREDLRAVFDTYPVTTIAPSFGCVLRGRSVVERHVALLDEVLVRAADEQSIGVTVGREAMGKV